MSNYIITGANSEIGKALIYHLIDQGHNILPVSRSAKDNTIAGKYSWIEGFDFTNEEHLLRLGEEIKEYFTEPFTVIHSVGDFWCHKSIVKTNFQEAISQINSHYITLYGVIKTVLPIMQQVGGGKIIAFSCNSVKYNYPDMAAFTSAKAAVECLIKCVANEQSKYNIIANAFALPSIKTKSVIETKPEKFHKDYATLEELVVCIEKAAENLTPLVNGSIINLFKYSHFFYNEGYYQRNKIWEEKG